MNRKSTKILSAILCTALCLCCAGIATFAQDSNSENSVTDNTPSVVSVTEESAPDETAKDETVYILAGANGSVEKLIVSDWIKNMHDAKSLTDNSELMNIENVKGDEGYTIDTDNMKVWDARGNDIYYQGNIDKELPVNLNISYLLDGKSISADSLAGKSGKVTIRFDYDNRQFETVQIDGKDEKIYVPFVTLTGMMLDNDIFKNIEVSGGKIINDGDHTAVVGIAFPGLKSNLGIESDKPDIPDYVEITADVKDFRLGMTVTLVTNEVFNTLDVQKLNSLDGLEDSFDQLADGINSLIDGSSQLYDGLCTLLDKSNELASGVRKLAEGAEKLHTGASDLDTGVTTLYSGMSELSTGLSTLSSNSQTLNNGAKQVFETLLATANTQLVAAGLEIPKLTIANYSDTLTGIINSLDEDAVYNQALQAVTKKVEESRTFIEQAVIESVRSSVAEKVSAAVQGLDPSMAENIISAKTEEQMQSDEVQSLISQNVELQVQKAINDAMESDEVLAQLAKASEGVKSVIELKASLDSYNTFYLGLNTYTTGVDSASEGAKKLDAGTKELANGTAQLKDGTNQLTDGIQTLKNSVPALTDGVKKLRDGALTLSDGLAQFNAEGIEELILTENNLSDIATRIKATIDVSKDYINFSGIAKNTEGKVRFIYRTDEIQP